MLMNSRIEKAKSSSSPMDDAALRLLVLATNPQELPELFGWNLFRNLFRR